MIRAPLEPQEAQPAMTCHEQVVTALLGTAVSRMIWAESFSTQRGQTRCELTWGVRHKKIATFCDKISRQNMLVFCRMRAS